MEGTLSINRNHKNQDDDKEMEINEYENDFDDKDEIQCNLPLVNAVRHPNSMINQKSAAGSKTRSLKAQSIQVNYHLMLIVKANK